MSPILDEWKDAIDLAASSPRFSVAAQVANLQTIRRKADELNPRNCMTIAHMTLMTSMDETIEGFVGFLSQTPVDVYNTHFRQAASFLDIYTKAVAP